MKKLLEFLVKSIVSHPQAVRIEEQKEENYLNLILKADPEDLKIIIGKNGRTIRALRELTRVKAINQGKKVNIEIQE